MMMHRGSKRCKSVCVGGRAREFFIFLFEALYFHSSDSRLQLGSLFQTLSGDDKCFGSEQTDLGPRCPLLSNLAFEFALETVERTSQSQAQLPASAFVLYE